MDLLKLATDWAKAELFSTKFFLLFAFLFLIGSIAFWQLGKTDLAKAYIYPSLVAGILLLIVGFGLMYSNTKRLNEFPQAYEADADLFLNDEIQRAEKTSKEFENVFKVIPIIILIAALIIIFVDRSLWRAIAIITIAMMVVILGVDGNSKARIDDYHKELKALDQKSE